MKRFVADTGPVLHLHEAGGLHLLPLLGEIFIPPLVIAELRANAPSLWLNLPPGWVKLQTLSIRAQQRAVEWQRSGLLHGGEAEALALAGDLKADCFLTDDAAARLMAESLGLEVRGSIGVVLLAAAKNLVSKTEAAACWHGLEKSSLWMSPKVRAEARAVLEKLLG